VLRILGRAGIMEVARCVPVVSREAISTILWMYKAFGLLSAERAGRATGFRFNAGHVLTAPILAVLDAIDVAMPHWRMVAEAQRVSERVPRHEVSTRRKPRRWKW
jgi:hypothetical protein